MGDGLGQIRSQMSGGQSKCKGGFYSHGPLSCNGIGLGRELGRCIRLGVSSGLWLCNEVEICTWLGHCSGLGLCIGLGLYRGVWNLQRVLKCTGRSRVPLLVENKNDSRRYRGKTLPKFLTFFLDLFFLTMEKNILTASIPVRAQTQGPGLEPVAFDVCYRLHVLITDKKLSCYLSSLIDSRWPINVLTF